MTFVERLFGLKGKVAVVIGGGGALGGAMAYGLAQAGARVAILGRTYANAKRRAGLIHGDIGSEAIAIKADASKIEDLQSARDEVLETLGGVDVLVNAPGINSKTPFFEITEEEWYRILDVNLKSSFLACQVFGEAMLERGKGGSIINISSASSGPPLSKVFTYGISKAGVDNLTQYLAREWGEYGIRVNAIAPGFFPAEQNRKILTRERCKAIFKHTPLTRFGKPPELIGAVIWLASQEASSFVTGAIIRVDGGFSAMTI